MNDRLLIKHIVNIPQQYIGFLNFLHPNFEIINDLEYYDNPNPIGIIYTGLLNDNIIKKLNSITNNWIIVNSNRYDDDLTTNEGLLKALLPIYYARINNSIKKGEDPVYKNIEYSQLLEKIKICLIDNSTLQYDNLTFQQSVYNLFTAILCTPGVLNSVYFNTVNSSNIKTITSSILSFLNKVHSQQVNNVKVNYARLISQSYRRYGKYIKQGIIRFVKSKSNPEIALYQLLTFLNRSK